MSSNISLRIHRVLCRDETGSTNWGADEIGMTGVWLNGRGSTGKIEPFIVSNDFDAGERVTYNPPKTILSIPFSDGIGGIMVNLSLYEDDWGGGLDEPLNEMELNLKKSFNDVAFANAPDAPSTGESPSEIPICWSCIAIEIGKWALLQYWGDDLFSPKLLQFNAGQSSSNVESITYTDDNSEYIVEYDWLVS